MRKRGIALLYVLLVASVMATLATALAFRYQQTVRTLLYDEGSVRARELADSAVELAVVLLRDHSLDWYKAYSSVVSSQDLGYSEARLGGRFELRLENIKGLYPSGQGTFLTIVGTGIAQGQRAVTAATVKLSSPLTNFVYYSSGTYTIEAWSNPTITGPIFAGSNGDSGDIRMWHDIRYYNVQTSEPTHWGGRINLNAQLKASGKIFIRNVDSLNNDYSQGEKSLDGTLASGDLVHDDINGVKPKGAVAVPAGVQAQPNIRVGVDLPKMNQVLKNFRAKKEKTVVDVSGYPNGVMAEFVDGQVVISEARPKVVGYVFDKDIYLSSRAGMVGEIQNNTNNLVSASEAETILKRSVVWDDPDLPNRPYPDDLKTDLDGNGVPESEGDATAITRVTRGGEIARLKLSRSEWQTLQLVTSKTDYPDAVGRPQAPPVYVRGNVAGKVNLVYDVTDDALDPKYDRLRTVVLADHEDPDDSDTKLTPPDAPGVPGGLRYQDPRIAKTPSDSEVSPDLLMVVSRGTISGAGLSPGYKTRSRDLDGKLMNYDQRLNTLSKQHSDYYTSKGTWAAGDFANTRTYTPSVSMFGIFIGSDVNSAGTRTVNGNLISTSNRTFPSAYSDFRWSQFGSRPAGVIGDHMAVFPLRQRNTTLSSGTWVQLRGSLSSLGNRLRNVGGDSRYDYKLQNLDSTVLQQELGLPVSVILCTWQRL